MLDVLFFFVKCQKIVTNAHHKIPAQVDIVKKKTHTHTHKDILFTIIERRAANFQFLRGLDLQIFGIFLA